MNGETGETIKAVVRIVPEEKYPFKILEARTSNKEKISVTMEEKQSEKGVEYLITVFNLQNTPTRYFEKVILKTDSKLRPELEINVYTNITDKKS
ncbi:Uncharacterized protein dnl_49990 [Desulfonema limicola]|uniref:Uncharacterized protein n=3 Tax=Desulfonema limicola TaxID=45656 RepID=A0A975GIH9_9BACT|nr:Uncharacterized protein dnl_49990 [Desulfonema limicola]